MDFTDQTQLSMINFWLDQAIEDATEVMEYEIKRQSSLLDFVETKAKEIVFITGGLSDVVGILTQRDFNRVSAELDLKDPTETGKKFSINLEGVKIFPHIKWEKRGVFKIITKSDGIFNIPNPIIGRSLGKREKHAVHFVLNWIETGLHKKYDILELIARAKTNYGLGDKR